jgi:hypothetical protein
LKDLSVADSQVLRLPEVTICAADSIFVDLTVRALDLSMARVAFGDAILFSDVPRSGAFRHVSIPAMRSLADYSRFVLNDLVRHVRTPYALVIQWDGYVVEPSAWRRAFLKYDYIGAPWPDLPAERAIGNGGFSLRSRRLMEAVAAMKPAPLVNEDVVIGHHLRPALETQAGMRFPPIKVAAQFSHEFAEAREQPFGFHGLENMPLYCDDETLAAICGQLDFAKVSLDKALIMTLRSISGGRILTARAAYGRLRQVHPQATIARLLRQKLGERAGDRHLESLNALNVG